nr:MAG TPA: hypothetical protein [Caudoviricetes sp.]
MLVAPGEECFRWTKPFINVIVCRFHNSNRLILSKSAFF